MPKRILLILAAVLVLAFLAYVGVSAANGSYTEAAGIGAQDATAAREGYAVLAKIQAAPGVKSATLAFTPGPVADRKSAFNVKLTPGVAPAEVRRVAELTREAYNHGAGTVAGAVLTMDLPRCRGFDTRELFDVVD